MIGWIKEQTKRSKDVNGFGDKYIQDISAPHKPSR